MQESGAVEIFLSEKKNGETNRKLENYKDKGARAQCLPGGLKFETRL